MASLSFLTLVVTDTSWGRCLRNNLTTSDLFDCAAKWIGFCPKSSVESRLAPSSRRSAQTGSWPAEAARWRGVCFFCSDGRERNQHFFRKKPWRSSVFILGHVLSFNVTTRCLSVQQGLPRPKWCAQKLVSLIALCHSSCLVGIALFTRSFLGWPFFPEHLL